MAIQNFKNNNGTLEVFMIILNVKLTGLSGFPVSQSTIAPNLIIVLLTIITLYEKHCNHRSQVDEGKLS